MAISISDAWPPSVSGSRLSPTGGQTFTGREWRRAATGRGSPHPRNIPYQCRCPRRNTSLIDEPDDLVVERAVVDIAALPGGELRVGARPDSQWLSLEVAGEVPVDRFRTASASADHVEHRPSLEAAVDLPVRVTRTRSYDRDRDGRAVEVAVNERIHRRHVAVVVLPQILPEVERRRDDLVATDDVLHFIGTHVIEAVEVRPGQVEPAYRVVIVGFVEVLRVRRRVFRAAVGIERVDAHRPGCRAHRRVDRPGHRGRRHRDVPLALTRDDAREAVLVWLGDIDLDVRS